MNKNIGRKDRVARFLIGMALLVLALALKSSTLAIIGAFSIFEAAFSWCVFYQLTGKNTCPVPAKNNKKVNFMAYLVSGLAILLVAIIANIVAGFIGWHGWYDVISVATKEGASVLMGQITVDNWIYLLVIYPFFLSYTGVKVYTLASK